MTNNHLKCAVQCCTVLSVIYTEMILGKWKSYKNYYHWKKKVLLYLSTILLFILFIIIFTHTVIETCASHLLCQGLFSKEPLSSWFSAVALSYALIDNPDGKEKLLNVKLASKGEDPPTLLQQIVSSIQKVYFFCNSYNNTL